MPSSPKPATTTESIEPSRQVGRLVKQVFASVIQSIDSQMQPLGLTAMQWEPLVLIHVGRVDTVAALARESQVNCGSMTRMLDRLEAKKLLRRKRSATDRRVVHLELTAAGRKLARDIMPLVLSALDEHLKGFKPVDVVLLTQMLERMLANGSRAAELKLSGSAANT